MATDTKVNIEYIESFGYGFNNPVGSVIVDSHLFIVDNQNHRILKFDLSLNFVLEFGFGGSLNDSFFFPHDICSDGSHLYITDSGNNRIKKHAFDGTFVAEITGFNYPLGITYNTNLFVADNQNNKVKELTTAGAAVGEISGLNFPTGVEVFENKILVADHDGIGYYDSSYNLVIQTNTAATSLKAVEGIVVAVDNQNNKLHFLSLNSEYEGSELFFPNSVSFNNSTLYVINSDNKILLYDFSVTTEIPVFAETFRKVTKELYPRARAWVMKLSSIFNQFHEALAYSESRAYSEIIDIRDSLIPDNDNFSEEDATQWERALGLYNQPYLDLATRKTIILRKMQFPGTVKARQHYKYIEGELQKVGFDVYIHENRFPDGSGGYETIDPRTSILNTFLLGQTLLGQSGITGGFTVLANYVEEAKDANFNIGAEINLRATFFVGGEVFGTRAVIPENRKSEFREMLLKLKPAQTVGAFLLTDYIPEGERALLLNSGGAFRLNSGSGFLLLNSET